MDEPAANHKEQTVARRSAGAVGGVADDWWALQPSAAERAAADVNEPGQLAPVDAGQASVGGAGVHRDAVGVGGLQQRRGDEPAQGLSLAGPGARARVLGDVPAVPTGDHHHDRVPRRRQVVPRRPTPGRDATAGWLVTNPNERATSTLWVRQAPRSEWQPDLMHRLVQARTTAYQLAQTAGPNPFPNSEAAIALATARQGLAPRDAIRAPAFPRTTERPASTSRAVRAGTDLER